MPSTNEEIEELFNEWADLLAVTGSDGFRVRAYERAARALGGHGTDLRSMTDAEILKVPSVGKGMAARVREFLEHGAIAELEELRAQVPEGLRDLTRVPGLGPKKAMLVYNELGVQNLDDLRRAIDEERLRDIKGLGIKTEQNLKKSLQRVVEAGERILVNAALDVAESVIATLTEQAGVERIAYAGSLRRMRETIGDIDILVASDDATTIMDAFVEMPRARTVLAHGETKSSIVTRRGVQVDLRVVPEDVWGAALIYFTGSKAHNIRIRQIAISKGYKLSEWGLFEADSGDLVVAHTEEEVYDALGLPFIPPTLREDGGEIEAALDGSLPTLIEESDIRGDLHSHTDMTDGVVPLEEMVAAAAKRGYEYYVITDHAENITMMGASREAMLEQRERIAELQGSYPGLRLLHGTELNIGEDGSVDYDEAFLAGYDLCVASVHSHFRQSREAVTHRVITAMENPNVHVIGHPAARKIASRDPIDLDMAAVCDAAVRTGTALEVNCFPDRLDLRDEHVRFAIGRGVTLAVDTDSHTPRDLMNLRFGIATAQRGWATAEHVLNAKPLDEVLAFVAAKRAR